MAISPVGKTRLMVSQVISTHTADGYNNGEPKLIPDDIATNDIATNDIGEEIPEMSEIPEVPDSPEEGIQGIPEDKNPTLTDYIFKTLENFGYPGRRLEEFKKKFVKESVSPDGTKDIKIEMPDRYYPDEVGNIKTIETDDLGKIVQDINSKFGLNFNGAERSEGKWLINLTSAQKTEEAEEGIVKDNLDEVYGTPSSRPSGMKKNKKDNTVRAFSHKELIRASKDDTLISKLSTINGE